MAGHSKWSQIKRKKAKIDAQKGATFARCSREITVAAKLGGADLNGNFRLRTAVEKAKADGLPADNIKRAIEKAISSSGGDNLEEINYEGYGPGGVAVLIECMTDNRNRTAGDIRSYFTKNNGNLGETGCVGWMFKQVGQITLEKTAKSQDELFDISINAGAEDFEEDEDCYKVTTSPEMLQSVAENIEKQGISIIAAEINRIAENTINVADESTAKYLLRLLDSIENHDDVQNVYANFEIEDEILEKLG